MQIHVLIDQSGSMAGAPISMATKMTESILKSLCNNSVCQEKAKICIVSYNIFPKVILPPTEASLATLGIDVNCEGPKNLGLALELALRLVTDEECCLFIITKGKPSDPQMFRAMCNTIKSKYKTIYVLHGNMDKSSMYIELTSNIIQWQNFDSVKTIQKIYGGQELFDANGNELLPAPPRILDLTL